MFATLRVAACTAVLCLFCHSARAQQLAPQAVIDWDGPVLERAAFVRAVLSAHPSVESARQAVRASHARAQQAGAFDDPMIELAMAPLSVASSRADLGYEVGISQALPWFRKRGRERDAMRSQADASENELEVTQRELALSAVALYSRYFVAYRSLEINAEHEELLSALQDIATSQLQAGHGSPQDVLAAEAERIEVEREALELTAERDVLVAQMNELLHRAPTSELPPPVAQIALDALPSASPKALEREAVAQRAEIEAARKRAKAQGAMADAALLESFPTITLSTSYSTMWAMPEHRFMVGVGINVPWPNDRRSGALDEARALRALYESEAERMAARARTEVYVALRRLQESDRLLSLYAQRVLPVARERVATAQASFTASQASIALVIEAEKGLRSVELRNEVAQAERDRRSAELQRALGRIPGLASTGGKP